VQDLIFLPWLHSVLPAVALVMCNSAIEFAKE